MIFESLDVVVVPFPFTDRRGAKRRPALVVSSADFNRAHQQSILAMITSAGTDWPSDIPIQGWKEAGLNVPCKVRFKLFTLADALVLRKLGRLSALDRDAVRNALGRVLGSDRSGLKTT